MNTDIPRELVVIAGKGVYPLLLARAAKARGVSRVFALAFRGETRPAIEAAADEVRWIRLGQLDRMLDALRQSRIRHAVMAGQITPTHLFRIRMDGRMLSLLSRLPRRNAETIFGALADELRSVGVELLPASTLMEEYMPAAGVLSTRPPDERERRDIEIGFRIAKTTSGLDIGQTVVVKEGTVLAVEAFEGTDRTIRRGARLGGPGAVVVKVAKRGHDMRFDIPVVGLRTIGTIRRARVSALAVEAGRAILLEREEVLARADRLGLCLAAWPQDTAGEQGTRPAQSAEKAGREEKTSDG